MALAPMAGGSAPANSAGTGEILAASMAKKQQQMEGAQAMKLLQTAGQAAPQPMGASGHNINISV